MLGSGAGMLAFALVELWGAVRDGEEIARRQARAQARRIAERLTGMLDSPEMLERLPEACRFAVRDGEVVVPPEVGWLDAPPPRFVESDLPLRAGVLLQRARQAEVLRGDRAESGRLLTEALAVPGLGPRDRVHLLTEAAWQAARCCETDRAASLWRELAAAPGLDLWAAASALLLARGPLCDLLRSDAAALGRLRRLAGGLPEEAGLDLDLDLNHSAVQLRRGILAAVRDRGPLQHGDYIPSLPGMPKTASAEPPAGFTLLLYGEGADRVGAVLWNPALRAWLAGHPPSLERGPPAWSLLPGGIEGWDVGWAEQLVFTPELRSADAIAVTAGIAVQPVVVPAPFWADPAVLIVLLSVLALCFGGGLYFSFRSVMRESAAMRARAEFLTSVTHELKTPLASIRLLSEMLDEGRVSGVHKQGEYYRLLAGESARLTVLIENVLDLGRMERGERAYDRRSNPVDEVVEEAARVFAPVAQRDGLELTVDLRAAGRVARIDRGAMVQALLNVMDNARKYARSGERLEVASRGENGTWHLSIRDHGPGVPPGEREAIFERFTRGAEQRHGAVAGVGLGLYLARAIARAHEGELRCVAPPGGGAEFVFSVPLAEEGKA